MSASDDEYDTQAGGAIELTEEDCAMIDALSAGDIPDASYSGKVAHIDVAIDKVKTPRGNMTPDNGGPNLQNEKRRRESPYELHRRRGHLSVTDLVAPTWCEVQFEYGLRQRRSRRIDRRPESFVSREGKEIHVEKETAQLNDVVLREGNVSRAFCSRTGNTSSPGTSQCRVVGRTLGSPTTQHD